MERHRTDTVSLVFGLLFTVVGIIGVSSVIELSSADVRWVAPSLLVLIGVLLVLPIGRSKPKERHLDEAAYGTDGRGHPTVDAAVGVAPTPSGGVGVDAEPFDGGAAAPVAVADPDVAEPDVAEPDVAEPDVAEPDVAEVEAFDTDDDARAQDAEDRHVDDAEDRRADET